MYSDRKTRHLRDITDRMMQSYTDPADLPNPPTPGVTPFSIMLAHQAATQLRYEQPAPWIPLTPPSSGRERDRNPRSPSGSPWKGFQTPNGSTTRTSPRKRLQLTPEKTVLPQSPNKRFKQDLSSSPPLEFALIGLSHSQLVNLIQTLAMESPGVRSKIMEILPLPDLDAFKDQLKNLRTCIMSSLPTVSSRIKSKTDAVAFSRAQVHVLNLKKYILQTACTLVKSEHWKVVVDFVFLAWNQMRLTPNWDNDVHNEMKRRCYKVLGTHLLTALEKGVFSTDEIIKIREQVRRLSLDSPSMAACAAFMDSTKFQEYVLA